MQSKTNGSDVIEIDVFQLLRALWRKAWAIILAAIIGGGAAFAYGYFLITPLYESSALLYVNNSSFSVGSTSFSISSGELSAAKTLVNTYIVILKTRSTLEEVIAETGVDYSYEKLRSMISTSSVDQTEIFSVKVTSPDPAEAEMLANTIARVLPGRISDVVDGSSVRVVDYAVQPSHKASPNLTKITMIGVLIGAVLCAAVIVIATILDDQIHDEESLRQIFDLPVLAAIPDLMTSSKSSGYGYGSGYGSSQKKTEAK